MIAKFFKSAIDIALPRYCLGCMSLMHSFGGDIQICSPCEAKISINPSPFCQICGINLINPAKRLCNRCQKQNHHEKSEIPSKEFAPKRLYFDRAWSGYVYKSPLNNIIHLFKYKGYHKLGKYLSELLVKFIQNYHLPMPIIDYLIPVPLHQRKLRQREFNQAQILTQELSHRLNIPALEGNLIRTKDTKSQTNLSPEQRITNVADAFCVRYPQSIENKNILLIDDVMTTGATSSQASYTLKRSGVKSVFVLTLARSQI